MERQKLVITTTFDRIALDAIENGYDIEQVAFADDPNVYCRASLYKDGERIAGAQRIGRSRYFTYVVYLDRLNTDERNARRLNEALAELRRVAEKISAQDWQAASDLLVSARESVLDIYGGDRETRMLLDAFRAESDALYVVIQTALIRQQNG